MLIVGMLSMMLMGPVSPPRMTVVISIDQFRADYLRRFYDFYLPAKTKDGVGGFRWLMEEGANFVNARYNHVPTFTGPGHAVIGTGSTPAIHGIVDNVWYDRVTKKRVYCVEDPSVKDVISGGPGMSPKWLQATTFGDELEMATNGKSHTVSIALKDRAAILMMGHLGDDVIWFDSKSGSWTTSTYYAKQGRLSAWVERINSQKIPDSYRGKTWTRSLDNTSYERTWVSEKNSATTNFGKTFPHRLGNDASFYNNFTRTPWANEFVFKTAMAAVTERGLGQDEVSDLLTINLSSNDYVGHMFGPDSPEVLDISVQTDRQLASFFRFLEKKVPGGLKSVLIVVTSDHGVLPIPEELAKRGLPGGRVSVKALRERVEAELKEYFEEEGLIAEFGEYMVYFDADACKEAELAVEDLAYTVREILLEEPSMFGVYTAYDIREGFIGTSPLAEMVGRSFNRLNSGDVLFFLKPGFLADDYGAGTSHGSPWAYDTEVPLLFGGFGVRSGSRTEPCGPVDIAATVCWLSGIGVPSGSVGRVLGIK